MSIIMIGGGGHARVLISMLNEKREKIEGIIVAEKERVGQTVLGCSVIGTDKDILKYPADQVSLVNGIGYIGKEKNRQYVYKRFKELGYIFEKIIHPTATIAEEVQLSEGVQIMAGSVIQVGSVLNENCIINTKVSIDHDCVVGNNVHLAPGVTVCGTVHIGSETFVGAGSTLGPNINIGRDCIIGAGSVVLRDVDEETRLIR
jgi:sugar O-acyltransferase (sialic acid O-acetyltransferase NeuD family)